MFFKVDEAHRLKRNSSVLFEKLQNIDTNCRLLLTGTPLQNSLSELWSLLSFILPDVFKDMIQFSDWFNRPFEFIESDSDNDNHSTSSSDIPLDKFDGEELQFEHKKSDTSIVNKKQQTHRSKKSSKSRNILSKKNKKGDATSNGLSNEEKAVVVQSLQRILKPFLLRRVKSEVAIEVPPKIERIVYCPQSSLQIAIHELMRNCILKQEAEKELQKSQRSALRGLTVPDWMNIDDDHISGSTGGIISGGKLNFQNVVMQLRKLCNHPFLVLEDVQTIPDEIYYKYVVASSGKLCMLDRLLKVLLHGGHKILIFSQLTTMLDIIQGYLYNLGINCLRLDGSTNREDRKSQIRAFSKSTSEGQTQNGQHTLGANLQSSSHEYFPVFLLSTRAGGVGINLQNADTVILYDSDWNPQQDLQAMSRAHRLGQTKSVLVLRLVSIGIHDDKNETIKFPSIEERILRIAKHKLETEKRIFAEGEFDMGTAVRDDDRHLQNMHVELRKEFDGVGGNLCGLFRSTEIEIQSAKFDKSETQSMKAKDLLGVPNLVNLTKRLFHGEESEESVGDILEENIEFMFPANEIQSQKSPQVYTLDTWDPWLQSEQTNGKFSSDNYIPIQNCSNYSSSSSNHVELNRSIDSSTSMGNQDQWKPKRKRKSIQAKSNFAEYSDEEVMNDIF